MRHITGDIRDFEALKSAFLETQPEFVFHLAAQPLVRRSYAEPVYTFNTNVVGSANVLEAIRTTDSVRAVIYVTSDKCYQNNEWEWGYRENDRLGGHDPYSASKACAELVLSSYQRSYFDGNENIALASVRAGNVIGGGDWAEDRIIPDCVRALKMGDAISVRNPFARRPWQHVLEPLSGYLNLAGRLYSEKGKQYSGAWNFGPTIDSNRPVADLVKAVVDNWGSGEIAWPDKDAQHDALHEANLLFLNCDKAQQILKWRPMWDFDQTISITIDWYKASQGNGSICDISQKQIDAYVSDCMKNEDL